MRVQKFLFVNFVLLVDYANDISNTDDFADFDSFKLKVQGTVKDKGMNDDFGDFGSSKSNQEQPGHESQVQGFGTFDAFKEKSTDLAQKHEFGDFGAFESKEKSVDSSKLEESNIWQKPKIRRPNLFENFRTFKSQDQEGSKSFLKIRNLNTSQQQTGNNLSNFKAKKDLQNDGIEVISSQRKKVCLKEQNIGMVSHFHPGHGI